MGPAIRRKTCASADGVEIVYSAAGAGEPALVFIHGGLANRSFWDGELRRFSDRYLVLAPDLAGHGESGTQRKTWGMAEFGADVRAVVDAERVERAILFGNSLGGPVAVEAALLLGERVLGVVGVDTFHTLNHGLKPEEAEKRAVAFRDDYAGKLRQMVQQLFHSDADPALLRDAERRMAHTSAEVAYGMFLSLGGYRPEETLRRLQVPLRAINGDLFPTDVAGVRAILPDFRVKVLEHVGHYPMLERPLAFECAVEEMVEDLCHHGVVASRG